MDAAHIPPAREDLLRFIRRFCERETCAAMELGTLQRHLGGTQDAEEIIRDLWREGLVEPTVAENDPEDGALFPVKPFPFDGPFQERTQFVLTGEGYAAVEQLVETRPADITSETAPPPSKLVLDVGAAVSAKLLEEFSRDPERLYQLSPRQFEELVAELFFREGYSVELTSASNDGGRDILAVRSQAFGRELIVAECKRYAPSHRVGVHFVRALYGVLEKERASRALLATTSTFTRGSHLLADELGWRMSLKDYHGLRSWLRKVSKKESR